MASAHAISHPQVLRYLANPWLWMLVSLWASGCAWVWGQLDTSELPPARILLVTFAVLAAAAAVTLQLNSRQEALPERLSASLRRAFLLLIAVVHAGVVLGVCGLLLLTGRSEMELPWSFTTIAAVAVLFIPVAGAVAAFSYLASTGRPFTRGQETASLLVLGAWSAIFGGWGLYDQASLEGDWDTMRTFLGGLTLFALVGAVLALLPRGWRRLCVSMLILLHFGGMVTSALRPSPTPWLVTQVWTRFYRPYLNFLYLNNAYQFYAPDPGPSHFMWFRLEYKDGKNVYSHWEKFPRLTKTGWPDYPMGLQYQRRLAMTDLLFHADPTSPPWTLPDKEGTVQINPVYAWRMVYSEQKWTPALGGPMDLRENAEKLYVPFHPNVHPFQAQYHRPTFNARKLLESAARHLATKPHPEHPEAKFDHVRIYAVVHNWPTPDFVYWRNAHAWTLYQAYYVGKYDEEGNLLDEPKFDPKGNLRSGDPLLYWLLPIMPKEPVSNAGEMKNHTLYAYVFRHAGDQKWVMYPGTDFWQEEEKTGPK
jgi:hypothetical protein